MTLAAHTIRRQLERNIAGRWRSPGGRYGLKAHLRSDELLGTRCFLAEEYPQAITGPGLTTLEVGEAVVTEIHQDHPWHKAMLSRRMLSEVDHAARHMAAIAEKQAALRKQAEDEMHEDIRDEANRIMGRIQIATR